MLDAVAELSEDVVGDVGRVLRDEVDADAFASDQTDDLLDLVYQRFGGVLEERVRLVEEEYQLRLVEVADFGQGGVELGEQPQQEGAVKLGLHHQFVGSEHAHDALAVFGLDKVVDVEARLPEEFVGSLRLELQQRALDGADGSRGDVPVLHRVFLGMFGDVLQHRTQVLEVDNHQPAFIGDAEDDVEHAVLGIVETEQTGEQLRSHLGDGGADWMSLFAVNVIETYWTGLELRIFDAELRQPLLDKAAQFAGLADARKVTLHVGHEAGHADLAESLGQNLQADRLSGAGGARDQTMPIGHFALNAERAVLAVRHV